MDLNGRGVDGFDFEIFTEGVLEEFFDKLQGSRGGARAGAAGALVMYPHQVAFHTQKGDAAAVVRQRRADGMVQHGVDHLRLLRVGQFREILYMHLLQNVRRLRYGLGVLIAGFVIGHVLLQRVLHRFHQCGPPHHR